jgi:hypothetical protein
MLRRHRLCGRAIIPVLSIVSDNTLGISLDFSFNLIKMSVIHLVVVYTSAFGVYFKHLLLIKAATLFAYKIFINA